MELRHNRPPPNVSFATPGLPVFVCRPEHSCFIVTRLCGLPHRDRPTRRPPSLRRETAAIRGLWLHRERAIAEASWGIDSSGAGTDAGVEASPDSGPASALRSDFDTDEYSGAQYAFDFEAGDEEDEDDDAEADDEDEVGGGTFVDDLEAVELEEQDDDIISKNSFDIDVDDMGTQVDASGSRVRSIRRPGFSPVSDDDDDFHLDDDELAAKMENSRGGVKRRGPPPGFSAVNVNAEDELGDDDELLQVDASEIQLGAAPALAKPAADADEDIPDPAMLAEEEFEDPTEEELQSAAELLTGSGLLGLTTNEGEDDSMRLAFNAPKVDDADDPLAAVDAAEEDLGAEKAQKGAKKRKAGATRLPKARSRELRFEPDDDEQVQLPLADDLEDDSPSGLEHYSDREEEEEAEFTIMSKTEGSFGRVWELNEDSYVTVTQPGQTYAYEMDEADLDDQEMSSQLRGAKGGWGSGLQNDAKNKYAPGSREWIARRSYDLIAQASARDMKLWTKRGFAPPAAIDALYEERPAFETAQLGKATLKQSMPDADPSFASKAAAAGAGAGDGVEEQGVGESDARSALERAVKFPCSFKFKVEGSGGDALIESLCTDVRYVLGQQLAPSAFSTEPAGRYMRVSFHVDVATAKHVTDLYDAFRANPLVKFSYG